MRRKQLCIWLAGMLLVSMLGGCGQKNYDRLLSKSDPVTVTVWHYYNGVQQTQLDEMVAEFNNTVGSEKGIIVEAYSKNSVAELADSVLAAASGNPGTDEMPNIFGTYAETAYQIDKLGKLVDLSPYLTEEEMDEYVDEYMEEGALGQEGTLKIFPTAKSTEIMMINETDWQKFADACGVTYDDMKTWEGLVDISEQYYNYTDALTPDVPNDGKAFFGRDAVANYMIVGAKQLGAEFAAVTEDGTVELNMEKEAVRKLWDNYYVPFVKGYFAAESRFRSDDAKIGTIIALIGSTASAAYYPTEVTIGDEYTYPIDSAVLPMPCFEGCDSYIVQQGAGMSVLKSDEKTEYACTVFLKWFTEAERNTEFSVNSGYLPVKKEANDSSAIATYCESVGTDEVMQKTLVTAIDGINSSTLYTSPPYDDAAAVRDYLGDAMENSAREAHTEALARIESGEDRESVWQELTDDEAFETWFADFEKGFDKIVGE